MPLGESKQLRLGPNFYRTLQLTVYADDGNLLGDNMLTASNKENTENLIDARREVGLDVMYGAELLTEFTTKP
jgi:hypothetical protein